ncbi:MAG: hypothetical protein KF774_16925 [Planctomyces sp.]|nr:hypothetical protein [Planctomyces sp.]
MHQPIHRPDRHSSSIAAAMLVLLQAAVGAAFVLVLVTDAPDRTFLLVGGAILVGAGAFIWLLSRHAGGLKDSMLWVFSRKARPEPLDYAISRRPVSFRRFGTNAPPSVDQIRDLKSGTTNNWVPSRTSGRASQH